MISIRKRVIFLIVLFILSLAVPHAFAWIPNDDEYSNVYSFESTPIDTKFSNPTGYAKNEWNYQARGYVSISASTSSVNKVWWYNYGVYSYYGRYDNYDSYFIIKIYDETIRQDYEPTKLENARRSVIGHELGHSFGLNEDPFTQNSLMNQGRDRFLIYYPQWEDVVGVRTIWG